METTFKTCFATALLLLISLNASQAAVQKDKNLEPINYQASSPTDVVARLKSNIEDDAARLKWNEDHGWLPSLLTALEIPTSSQTLVFSKTSQQQRKIRPSAPRAIYFNDEVYIGFVQKGDFLEIASVDPQLGAVFYTIEQSKSQRPLIERSSGQCMACHESHRTQDVPGFLVRSVFPKKSGHPDFTLGTTHTDHSTPFMDRFGGWYVTGEHGSMRHRGNAIVDKNIDGFLDRETGANLRMLPKKSRPEDHLEPTSDLVALMILEHQTQFHNFVTKANYTARQTLHHQATMNRLFEREAAYQSDSTKRQIHAAADDLVEYLFFVNEFPLKSTIKGNSTFAKDFEAKAIRTPDGKSLRDLDLKTRLLKYPCSYLVYSDSFLSLPDPILNIVKKRMLEVLEGRDASKTFSHLSSTDRKDILSILSLTHPLFRDGKDQADTD